MTIVGWAGSSKADAAREEGSGMTLIPPNLTLTLYSGLDSEYEKWKREKRADFNITLFQYCKLAFLQLKDLRH